MSSVRSSRRSPAGLTRLRSSWREQGGRVKTDNWRSRWSCSDPRWSLGTMAVRVAEQYSSQREDVHGEMVSLGGRWEAVVSKIEPGFSLVEVEVEQIKTTISQLVIPPAALVQATSVPDKEEIMTLAEEQLPDLEEQVASSPQKEKSRSSSKEKSKSPPPTLPKPRWYVESMQAKRNGNTPVRQVDKRYSVQAI